jgi:hypothetical protein
MKKLLFTLVLLISISAFSQKATPFIIEHCKDAMTDVEYLFSQKKLICANASKTQGFTITPKLKSEEGSIILSGLMCENVNIGNCDENDKLIFLFEDNTKITLISFNKFNCKGNAYFDFENGQLSELSTKKIKDIRFSNGYSFESLTVSLRQDQQDYFLKAITNQKVVEVDCSK